MRWAPDQIRAAAEAAALFIQGALRADPHRDRADLESAAWMHVLMELAVPGGWGEPDHDDYAAVMQAAGRR